MDDLTALRINSLLQHIDKVLEDTKGVSKEGLKQADLLLRATCFSLSQIGEMMNQLEKTLHSKYPNLPWIPARRMRNVVIHDYGHADIDQIYSTIREDLPALKDSVSAMKADLLSLGN